MREGAGGEGERGRKRERDGRRWNKERREHRRYLGEGGLDSCLMPHSPPGLPFSSFPLSHAGERRARRQVASGWETLGKQTRNWTPGQKDMSISKELDDVVGTLLP